MNPVTVLMTKGKEETQGLPRTSQMRKTEGAAEGQRATNQDHLAVEEAHAEVHHVEEKEQQTIQTSPRFLLLASQAAPLLTTWRSYSTSAVKLKTS